MSTFFGVPSTRWTRGQSGTGEATILADGDDGLVFPSTLAFGQRGADKHAVFVANFGFGAGPSAPVSVLRIEVGEESEKYPAGT